MSQLDRRTVLKAGGVLAAAALTSCTDTKDASAGAPNWNSLAHSLAGRVYLPASSGYAASHQLFNPRTTSARPSIRTCSGRCGGAAAGTSGWSRRSGWPRSRPPRSDSSG
ncbi:twin-arginine translocation signal domain-containing protein [Kribbella sp. NBC_00889]|uniref:twin-arginine translocation signal domain-containing protein n=1 Tax=Kribbella sp. NBC_00889 TaxID=2975974 RepID=UPI00386B65F6